jgi:hypothetical protein
MAPVEQDNDHLRLLSIFYYAWAAIVALMACVPILFLIFGVAIVAKPQIFGNNGPPAFFGYIWAIVGGIVTLVGWATAFCCFLTGRFLALRKHYVFCLIVAGVNCMNAPFGTILGVFTIVVLVRPSVKAMFLEAVPQSGL